MFSFTQEHKGKGNTNRIKQRVVEGYKNPEDFTDSDGLLKQLTKAILERILESELMLKLDYQQDGRLATVASTSTIVSVLRGLCL